MYSTELFLGNFDTKISGKSGGVTLHEKREEVSIAPQSFFRKTFPRSWTTLEVSLTLLHTKWHINQRGSTMNEYRTLLSTLRTIKISRLHSDNNTN